MTTKQSSPCINRYRGCFVIFDWSTSTPFLKQRKQTVSCESIL
ncbi:hypothetical protein D349_00014 [Enterococcus faecalis UP2S-6]|nr:hypothetical protein D349_00014 [Enterococcus faecalis UP2S-6]